jgi:catechol 2,3-dioxygenase-like lactoylglutathione lyase family enzyme
MSRFFGPIMQNGYIVDDLDRALDHWVKVMGVGPFYVMPTVRMVDPMYRGKPCEVDMSVALANSGAMQIELIWQKNAAPSIYKEWLDEGRTGLHHVGFFVDDIEATLAALPAQPERLQWGQNFCYIDTVCHPGTMVELIQSAPRMQELFGMIREASAGWRGDDPVRILG